MRKFIISLILLMLSLCGCSEPDVVIQEPAYTPLRVVMDSVSWDGMVIDAFTPVSSFEATEDSLTIFPYNDNDGYIKVERFIFSGNNIFETMISSCTSDNVQEFQNYTVFTLQNGTSMTLVKFTDDTGYLVTTKLPSSYCKKVADVLWMTLGL